VICLKEALRTRISRERVGIELEKMLKGEYILLTLSLLEMLNLAYIQALTPICQ
jgi:tRNA nucleotidyltransferase/poly(A) polymerase